MKKRIVASLAVMALGLSVGCHAQIPPNPSILTCPASSGSAYAPLNQSAPATGLTYSDNPGAGNWCYVAQSVLGANSSNPSNTAGVLTFTASNHSIGLSWTAPTTGPAPSGYVISRAPAVVQTLGAPNLGGGTVAENVAPDTKPAPEIAACKVGDLSPQCEVYTPLGLTAKLEK